jgi:hypothetical protein
MYKSFSSTSPKNSALYQALGGFRGLATDILSLYALKESRAERFEEIPTLAQWLVRLQPRLSEPTLYWSSEMAWNISVLHKDYALRWSWVKAGIRLLRNALEYSDHPDLYLALAEIYRLRIGEIIEPADAYFKYVLVQKVEQAMGGWSMESLSLAPTNAVEMNQFLGDGVIEKSLKQNKTSLEELFRLKQQHQVLPKLTLTTQEKDLVSRYLYRRILESELGIDVEVAATLDALYGPLDWRLPESLSTYWSYLAIHEAELRGQSPYRYQRMFYRSLTRTVSRGHLLSYNSGQVQTLPNFYPVNELLKLFPKLIKLYPKSRKMTETNYSNFLKETLALGFVYGEREILSKTYAILCREQPRFVAERGVEQLSIDILSGRGKSHDYRQVQTLITGLFSRMFILLESQQFDEAEALNVAAYKIWVNYQKNPNVDDYEKNKLAPLQTIKHWAYEYQFGGEKNAK